MSTDAEGRELFQQRTTSRLDLNGRRGLFAAMHANLLLDDRRQILDLRHARWPDGELLGRRRDIVLRHRLLDAGRWRRGIDGRFWRGRADFDFVGNGRSGEARRGSDCAWRFGDRRGGLRACGWLARAAAAGPR